MAIWRSCIAKYLLAIWRYFIAKCTLATWRYPIAKHTLTILATSYCLNRNNIVSTCYWTRRSKLCFLTCFSYFSHYFPILVFLQNCYSPISLHLSCLHGNLISCPVSHTFGNLSWYLVHVPPCFWHRKHGFLEARCSWEPGSRLTTGDFSLFRLSPKVSGANVFLRDISPAKLRSTAWVRIPKVFPNSWIGLIVGFLALCSKQLCGPSLLQNPLQWDPQHTTAIRHASQSQSQTTSSHWATVILTSSEAPWMWCAIVGADHSASLSCILQGSQVCKEVVSWDCFCMWLPCRKGT